MSTESKTSTRPVLPKGFRWFAAGATTLAILLSIPATREIVRSEVYSLKSITLIPTLFQSQEQQQKTIQLRLREEAARHPNDVAMQVSLATPPRTSEYPISIDAATIRQDLATANDLKQLSEKYPNSALPPAALLRTLTRAVIRSNRDEENLLSPPDQRKEIKNSASASLQNSKEALTLFEEAVERGEKVDPENAYFPAMHMISLVAQHRDNEAITELARAARAPKWNEYATADGRIHLEEAMNGTKMPAIAQASIVASELFPHYSQVRSTARTLTALAIKKELSGDKAGGYAIRHDLSRLGSRMRVDGQFAISSLVGIAITGIASHAPNGQYIPNSDKLTSDARAAQYLTDYTTYLKENGYNDEAVWYATEAQTGLKAKMIIRAGMNQSLYCNPVRLVSSAAGWSISGLLLFNIFCTLLIGQISTTILRQAGAGTQVPLRGWMTLTLGAVSVAIASALLVYCAGRIFSPLVELSTAYSDDASETGSSHFGAGLIAAFLAVSALVFTGSMYARKSKKEGRPAVIGMLHQFRDQLLTNTGVLLLLYCAATGFTSYMEHNMSREMDQLRQHEGRYLAHLLDQEWPGETSLLKKSGK